MDRSHHDFLGNHDCIGRTGAHFARILRSPIPSRGRRSGVLSWHHRVSHALVPTGGPRKSDRHVHDGNSFSNIFGSPIAGQILRLHWLGLQGWRWLFILEGVPAVIFGFVTLFYLTDWPGQAAWLPKEECDWITGELEREKQEKASRRGYTIWQALRQRDVLLLTLIYFMGSTGVYGFIIWFPTILKRASGLSTVKVTLLVVLPYIAGLVAMMLNGWHSDRTRERRWHTAISLIAAGACLVLAIAAGAHLWIQLGFFILFAAFINAYQPTFWTLPSKFLGESAAAASIGLINCVGGLGGFAGPYIMGYLVTRSGSFVSGLFWLVANILLGGILILCLR